MALDIGAGIGKAMVSLSAAGFDVTGIEPSTPFRDKAIEHMGIASGRIAHTSIEAAEFPGDSFDFITFGAVLEHLYDPAGSIEKAMRWLRPGGVMQIEVPSSNHLVAKFINLYNRLRGVNYVTHLSPMHSPFHLYEFDLATFAMHAQSHGYAVVKYTYEVCSVYKIPKVFHRPLKWWMERHNSGMQLVVWLRKLPAA